MQSVMDEQSDLAGRFTGFSPKGGFLAFSALTAGTRLGSITWEEVSA
jgi:hypothetical protein